MKIERVRLYRSSSLPRIPLLITESAEEFERLRTDIEQEIKPLGIIEQIYVSDVIYIVWDIMRLRRCKDVIVNTGFPDAIKRLLDRHYENSEIAGELEDLACGWFTEPKAKKRVAELLGQFQLDELAIEAEAMREMSPDLERLDGMLSSLESRRDKALDRVAAYRDYLGHQLRQCTDRLIEGKPVPALLDDPGKKSAA